MRQSLPTLNEDGVCMRMWAVFTFKCFLNVFLFEWHRSLDLCHRIWFRWYGFHSTDPKENINSPTVSGSQFMWRTYSHCFFFFFCAGINYWISLQMPFGSLLCYSIFRKYKSLELLMLVWIFLNLLIRTSSISNSIETKNIIESPIELSLRIGVRH